MTTSFEAHLRDQLLGGLPAHRRRRQRRDRAVLALGAVLLVVALAVGFAASTGDDGATEIVDSVPQPTASSPTPSSDAPPTTGDGTDTTESTPTSEPVGGPDLDPAVAAEAEQLVGRFLRLLRDDDVAGAAALWTGYPGATGTAGEPPDLEASTAVFRDETAWLLDDPDPDLSVAPSPSSSVPSPVVTVVADQPGGGRRAATFVVSAAPPEGFTGLAIVRLPEVDVPTTPPAGSPVAPGSTVTFLTSPIEGGARAYVDGIEVPVEDDRAAREVRVTIPPDASGDVTVTVAFATPDLPAAGGAWFPVG